MALKFSQEDAHARVGVLFHVPDSQLLIAVSVKFILQYGAPKCPDTGVTMEYEGTYVIQ